MKKNSASFRTSGAYTSPGTPEHCSVTSEKIPKNWCSERVPLPSTSRSHISAAALMPFNSGRALPSKWDDAERWITSPISGPCKAAIVRSQRRARSKSGPLGDLGGERNFVANSPLMAGVFVPEGLSVMYDRGCGVDVKSNFLYEENGVNWRGNVAGLSDLLSVSSVLSSQDDEIYIAEDEEKMVSRVVSRRDMATQMSPEGSTNSSPKGRLSFSALTSSSWGPHVDHVVKDEVRDVQVDKGTNPSSQSKKQGRKNTKKSKNIEEPPSHWNAAEASKNTLKLQREEAKITAWENLQKAKAEAAIQKLEMKLENKRSKSMDKILNELTDAQIKAQAMRNLPSENHIPEASRTSRKGVSCLKYAKIFCRRN